MRACDYVDGNRLEGWKTMSYLDYLPEDGHFEEEDLWEAIAEANGLDVSEIMDGDLVEWL